jgi:DNA-binding GntR family transcriptional regulator
VIELDSELPAYRQLADAIRGRIQRGQLRPGDRLPSETEMAARYKVSRETVRRALTLLRTQGLITTRAPRGSFVRGEHERRIINPPAGALITCRPATEQERRRLRLALGEPIVVVDMPDGTTEKYPADRVQFRIPGPGT